MDFKHTSVLLEETIENLRVKPEGIYVDGTLGGAGHALEVCRRLSATGRFIGIDQDEEAIAAAEERLREYKDKAMILRSNYRYMVPELKKRGITAVDGILLDLGVSSRQLDEAGRGFTYREDAPLDMRMDRRQELTAAEVVNTYSEEGCIRSYGTMGKKNSQRILRNASAGRGRKSRFSPLGRWWRSLRRPFRQRCAWREAIRPRGLFRLSVSR